MAYTRLGLLVPPLLTGLLACMPALLLGSTADQQPPGLLRGRNPADVDSHSVQDLRRILVGYLNSIELDADSVLTKRAYAIQASMARTYQALPKNEYGHLGSRSVLYLVQSYFAKEHGWLINGLEPQGTELSLTQEVQDLVVLREKVPNHLMSILADRHMDRGLSFDDIVAMVAFLERLILNESIDLLDAAYGLNNCSTDELLNEEMMHEVLTSYLYVFRDRRKLDYEEHQNLREVLAEQIANESEFVGAEGNETSTDLPTLADFEGDELLNMVYEHRDRTNPFREPHFSFDGAAELVDRLAQRYGKWQNEECLDMKQVLMGLDPHRAGLVPLDRFYMHTSQAGYQFWESKEYLRQVGALDETLENRPRVRITNYVLGPSNCIASSEYFSVCCLNECKNLMSELEGHIQAPVASPKRIIRLVGNMSSSSIEAPRQLSMDLEDKLKAIADHHGGHVPLHGRLFAQWLYFAFPNECPYPWSPANAEVSQVKYWDNDKHMATAEEMAEHIRSDGHAMGDAATAAAERPAAPVWTSDEVLPLLEPDRPDSRPTGNLLRFGVQLVMFVFVINIVVLGVSAALKACRGQGPGKKDTLPLYF